MGIQRLQQSLQRAFGYRRPFLTPNSDQLIFSFKWGVPLNIVLLVIHWLVSEAYHLVQVNSYTNNPKVATAVISEIYLCISYQLIWAIIIPIAGGSYTVLVTIVLLKMYHKGMSLAGICSASIAAACQPSRIQIDGSTGHFPHDLAHEKLKWGVTHDPDETLDGIGHATFSAGYVFSIDRGKAVCLN